MRLTSCLLSKSCVFCWWLSTACKQFYKSLPTFILFSSLVDSFISSYSFFHSVFLPKFYYENVQMCKNWNNFTLNTCVPTTYRLLQTSYYTWCIHICPSIHPSTYLSVHLILWWFCVLFPPIFLCLTFFLFSHLHHIYFRVSVGLFYFLPLLGFEICLLCVLSHSWWIASFYFISALETHFLSSGSPVPPRLKASLIRKCLCFLIPWLSEVLSLQKQFFFVISFPNQAMFGASPTRRKKNNFSQSKSRRK